MVTKPSKHFTLSGVVQAIQKGFHWVFTPNTVKFVTVLSMRRDAIDITPLSYVRFIADCTGRQSPAKHTLVTACPIPVAQLWVIMTRAYVFVLPCSIAMDTVNVAPNCPSNIVCYAFLAFRSSKLR